MTSIKAWGRGFAYLPSKLLIALALLQLLAGLHMLHTSWGAGSITTTSALAIGCVMVALFLGQLSFLGRVLQVSVNTKH